MQNRISRYYERTATPAGSVDDFHAALAEEDVRLTTAPVEPRLLHCAERLNPLLEPSLVDEAFARWGVPAVAVIFVYLAGVFVWRKW